MKDIAAMEDVRQDWKEMDPSRKAKYEQLAKEAKDGDQKDLSNKFTCSGESYALVNERVKQAEIDSKLMSDILESATREDVHLNERNFVILKTTHTCEVAYPNSSFWPVELAMASFKLKTGLVSKWWTLVNTVQTPTGYASAAKDTFESTALPFPGSHVFKPPHGDYKKILNNVKNFISHHVQDHNGYYVVFVMPNEEASTQGCLRWLHENADYDLAESQNGIEDFLGRLQFIKVSQLLLKLAAAARRRDASYNAPIAMFDYLDDAALRVLNKGDYNFKDNITCAFHNLEDSSTKMQHCCLNIVLRTIFIILGELIQPLKIEPTTSHFISCVKTPDAYVLLQERVPEHKPMSSNATATRLLKDAWGSDQKPTVAKTDDVEGLVNYPTLRTPAAGSSFNSGHFGNERAEGLRNAWDMPRRQSSTPTTFTNDDFPSLESGSGVGGGRGRPVWGMGLDSTQSTPQGGRGRGGGHTGMPDFIGLSGQESQPPQYGGRGRGFGSR